eukprot:CAMPEP_0182420236 /NCGR_PEP_ID=MMETSP1167-20130531/4893_1 /TAXON_ID=2988 /ORGANISM="Mallomonas Sp, Strain CCMP3275" /LENGTH=127 /DNA_ID=CAMNT_0024595931 /DNA_START=436 /DNA_END=819 /DNA_ORIENTATION=+
MEGLGLDANVSLVFVADTNFIVEVTINDVNLQTLISFGAGKERAGFIDKMLNIGATENQYSLLHTTVSKSVAEAIGRNMATTLPGAVKAQMHDMAGLEMDVKCCMADEQCEVLLSVLKSQNIGQPKH